MLILMAILSDDNEFIKNLFKEHGKFFYNIAMNILHNQHNAEDVIQEAFLKISMNIDRIMGIECPQRVPYCVIIVKHVSLNMLRANKKIVVLDETISNDTHLHGDETPEAKYVKKEEVAYLKALIDSLPEQDQQLIHMKWSLGMGYKEIAVLLNITEDAAKKRSQRIISKIRTRFEEKGGF